jgi:hypothetical protein
LTLYLASLAQPARPASDSEPTSEPTVRFDHGRAVAAVERPRAAVLTVLTVRYRAARHTPAHTEGAIEESVQDLSFAGLIRKP